jgi:hypothetical protein
VSLVQPIIIANHQAFKPDVLYIQHLCQDPQKFPIAYVWTTGIFNQQSHVDAMKITISITGCAWDVPPTLCPTKVLYPYQNANAIQITILTMGCA